MNKIVIELCTEDRARLDRLAELIEKLAEPVVTESYTILPQQGDVAVGAVKAAGEKVETIPEPQPEPQPEPAPVVSLADFQKAIVTRCAESPETKKKVQALVTKYADRVSNVPEEQRAQFLDELAKI